MSKARPFYIYRIMGEMGETIYIGKGTGSRLARQKRRFKSDGEIMETFIGERQAYRREKQLIALHNPPMNKCGGGGGGIFGSSNPALGTEEMLFEMCARIIRTLTFYKQIRHFKTDIKAALQKFVEGMAKKYGPDEFAERLLPYNIKVINN